MSRGESHLDIDVTNDMMWRVSEWQPVGCLDSIKSAPIKIFEDPLGKSCGGTGTILWDAAVALTMILQTQRSWVGVRVIELGAGVGLTSMVLVSATLGLMIYFTRIITFISQARLGAVVTATELGIATELLRKNANENEPYAGSLVVRELDWGWVDDAFFSPSSRACTGADGDRDERGAQLLAELIADQFEVVVGSDLVYPGNGHTAQTPLAKVIKVLLAPGTSDSSDRGEAAQHNSAVCWLANQSRANCAEVIVKKNQPTETDKAILTRLDEQGLIAIRMDNEKLVSESDSGGGLHICSGAPIPKLCRMFPPVLNIVKIHRK